MTGFEQVQHPLLIDLVLEQVFKNLGVEHLLTSRLVSRQWSRLAAKPLSNKQDRWVSISTPSDLYSFISTLLSSGVPHIWTHIELDLESIPPNDSQLLVHCVGPYLKSIRILPGNSFSLIRLFKLFRAAPQLKCLELEGLREMIVNELSSSVSRCLNYQISTNRLEEFQECLSDEEDFLPINAGLRHLKIAIQIERDSPATSFSFFASLFKIFPKLSHLEVSSLDMWDAANTTINGGIQALEQSSILPSLTSLRIDDLTNAGLERLTGLRPKGMRLRKLQLLSFLSASGVAIENFIRSQAESLEELTLGGQYEQGGNAIVLKTLGYPFVMPNLKVLNISSGVSIAGRMMRTQTLVWEVDFSSQFPNLRSLGLHYFNMYYYDTVFPIDKVYPPCATVRKLDIAGGNEVVPERHLVLLGQIFPNATDLTITVGIGQCISTVCGIWGGGLRKFHLVIKECFGSIPKLDEWLTGVVIPVGISGADRDLDEFQDLVNEPTGRMSLTTLKELESLRITIDLSQTMGGVQGRILPSDLTGMLAIRQLKNLKELVINRTDMTENCVRVLREELDLQKCAVGDRRGTLISFAGSIEENVAEE